MDWHLTLKHVLGLGVEPKDLTFLQMSLRAVIVFVVSLAVVRVANKRFLSKMSAFDAILGFILASMLARAVNGSSAFFPTLGTGFVLVAIHAIFARFAFRSDRFGFFVKGESQTLVEDGIPNKKALARSKISEKDLLEEARMNGQITSVKDIKLATLERSGEISIIPKD